MVDLPYDHEPVLLDAVVELLGPVPGGVYCVSRVRLPSKFFCGVFINSLFSLFQ